uniref:MATH domain-containing protein n=1 Tax=Brassica campestris TaxID=3711 RepID=A0A3P6BUW9_BRACM|nr:unnamed protein product [Brassica rapa]
MGNETDKKFTWVIKNFSSWRSKCVRSRTFVLTTNDTTFAWYLLAGVLARFREELTMLVVFLSLYLVVSNPVSLPSGWRRHAKFSFTLCKSISWRKIQYWFDQKDIMQGFQSMICLSDLNARDSGFLVNDELKIVAEIDVLEVVGELDVPVVTTDIVDINGFQVLSSQVESVNSLFEKHPNIASNVRAKNPHLRTTYLNNPHLRTTYLNFLLSLTEILCKSHEELSNSDLADAYSSLTYLTKPGFKLDWLEKALKEAGETRIQDIEEELNDLTQKCADMDALQKFLK